MRRRLVADCAKEPNVPATNEAEDEGKLACRREDVVLLPCVPVRIQIKRTADGKRLVKSPGGGEKNMSSGRAERTERHRNPNRSHGKRATCTEIQRSLTVSRENFRRSVQKKTGTGPCGGHVEGTHSK